MEHEHDGCGCHSGEPGKKCCESVRGTLSHPIVGIVMIVAIAGVLGLAVVKDAIFTSNNDTVQVTGHVEVPMKADTAEVNVGVLTITAPTEEEAIKITSDKIAAVEKAIQEVGVVPENYQLTGYAVNPRYKEGQATDAEGKPTGAAAEIIGFTCSQQITIRIPKINGDTSTIDRVLSAASKAGANQAGEVRLFVSDLENAKQEARLAAVKDARDKAKAVTDAAEVRLKGVGSWYENVISVPGSNTPTPSTNASFGSPAPTPTGTLASPAGTASLGAGNQMLVVEVNVTYYIH
ncbi:MAG: SIMPL domain-containing protein [Candidatus Moraniibacteriota bacterium]